MLFYFEKQIGGKRKDRKFRHVAQRKWHWENDWVTHPKWWMTTIEKVSSPPRKIRFSRWVKPNQAIQIIKMSPRLNWRSSYALKKYNYRSKHPQNDNLWVPLHWHFQHVHVPIDEGKLSLLRFLLQTSTFRTHQVINRTDFSCRFLLIPKQVKMISKGYVLVRVSCVELNPGCTTKMQQYFSASQP